MSGNDDNINEFTSGIGTSALDTMEPAIAGDEESIWSAGGSKSEAEEAETTECEGEEELSVEGSEGSISFGKVPKENILDDYPIEEGAEEDEILDDDYPQYECEEIEEISEEMSESGTSDVDASTIYTLPDQSKPSTIAHRQLDRDKLIEALHEAYALRQKEERKNLLLNKKMVEYFRRKKSSRALHDDNADIVFEHINKYRNLLNKLNNIKGQEEELKKQSELRLGELRQEELALKEETAKNVDELNKLLREVGVTCQSTKTGLLLSEKVVEKYIRKMNLLREQISEVRLELLKSQDKVTAVLLKTKQLEDLGDGLKVINFEQLRAETQSLSDKIEERNNELAKLRRRCNSDIHVLAHVREKQSMLSSTILVQEGVLRDLQNEESSCRNYLNYIKLERDELRKKLKEMSFDCGLLDKPALLRDYDRTVEKIKVVAKEVSQLNAEKDKILEELRIATLNAESKMAIKTDMQKFDEALNQELANLDKLPYPRIKQGIKPARNIDLSRYRADWQN